MIKGKGKAKLWRGLSGVAIALLCVMIGVVIASFGTLRTYVNGFFGTSSVKTIKSDSGGNTTYYESEFDSVTELVEAREEINKQVAREGAALLKNNNALPFTGGKPKVTFLGMQSHQPMYDISSGAAAIGNADQITSYEDAFIEKGFELNPTTIAFYESLKDTYKPDGPGGFGASAGKYSIGEVPLNLYTDPVKESFAQYNDAAIIFIQRNIGEGNDLYFEINDRQTGQMASGIEADLAFGSDGVHDSLQLQNREWELIELAKQNFDKIIIFLNSSNPIESGDLQNDEDIDAILWTGGVGTKGAYGIADILLGVSPSGGLVDTYATDNHSAPAMMNFGHFEFSNSADIQNARYGRYYIVEAEGVYVGYKYYETRYEDSILGSGNANSAAGRYASTGSTWNYAEEVVYPFGYGLSYTTFSEEIQSAEWDGDEFVVTVHVKNTGGYKGKDNVQLYMQAPYTEYDEINKVEKPFTFIGCVKTEELAANGGEETVTIRVDKELIASYDYVNAEAYLIEAGDYWFAVGDGAHHAVNNMLAAMGRSGLVDEEGNAAVTNVKSATRKTFRSETIDEGVDGYEIKNRLQDYSDLNSFQPGTVTYLSRSDWNGTYPKSYNGIKAEGTSPNGVKMFDELNGDTYVANTSRTIDFKYGNPDDTDYTVSMMIGNDDWDNDGWDLILNQMSLADLVSLAFPIPGPSAVEGADIAYSVSFPGGTGSEGPSGNDVGFCTKADYEETGTPYYMTDAEAADPYLANYSCSSMHQQSLLAATFDPALALRMGEIFGEDTLWTHCTAMEIGVNNHRTAYGGRNCEYYSECGNLGYIMGAAEGMGIESKGGYCMPKHVFGNDQETHRQGLATFANEAAMREIQLRACEGAFVKAHARKSMTSFSRYGVIQSAYSTEMFEIIRGEWGCFDNVDMTDMAFNNLMYGARSVIAGTTTFCSFVYAPGTSAMSYYNQINPTTVAADADLAYALRESAKRQLYIWANSNDANGYDSSTRFVNVIPWWQPVFVTVLVLFAVCAVGFAALYIVAVIRKKGEVA